MRLGGASPLETQFPLGTPEITLGRVIFSLGTQKIAAGKLKFRWGREKLRRGGSFSSGSMKFSVGEGQIALGI
ncbi:hypothetical protein D1164_20490 [Mariniphaga sediminis]|uniref:Uncharacterized protein n=1 Tax=Mariniphaga sediminis TaxID=1628158 RepID=A0A399CTI5_9BACT|nr:hypothetical protein D1164_20490 [Mariniphaga sediminis]